MRGSGKDDARPGIQLRLTLKGIFGNLSLRKYTEIRDCDSKIPSVGMDDLALRLFCEEIYLGYLVRLGVG